jgi:hypothetical protein
MDYLLVFISGFSTCAVALGTLWFLRECERARAFKAMRKDIDILRERDERRRQLVASIYIRMQELRLSFGGKAMLPAPVKQVGQRPESFGVFAGPSLRGGPRFLGGSNEQ